MAIGMTRREQWALIGVVLLIAREMGIDVSELASVAYENLLARGKVETCLPTRLES